MTAWRQDQIDYPRAIDDFVIMYLLGRISEPTRYISVNLELALAPCSIQNPEFGTLAMPLDLAEDLLEGMDAYERTTGETVWVDRFWKQAKPWRIELRRLGRRA